MSASTELAAAAEALGQLTKAWRAANLSDTAALLASLKPFVLRQAMSAGPASSAADIVVARDILEIGALHSLKVDDLAAFERYYKLLKIFYIDLKNTQATHSTYMYEIMGAHLLYLLVDNKLTEFHWAVEHFSPAVLHENIYIKFPVSLEQYLMQGAYNRILLASSSLPAESFGPLVQKLLATLSDVIASSCEAAYQKIPVNAAAKLLFLSSEAALLDFVASRQWTIEGDSIFFPAKPEAKLTVPSTEQMERMLSYARDLERIV
eukprot:m.338916 g.338916  ORF g.338916 m.338916 type:complete len:264 (-) comp55739_c0_seq1:186-977(-)